MKFLPTWLLWAARGLRPTPVQATLMVAGTIGVAGAGIGVLYRRLLVVAQIVMTGQAGSLSEACRTLSPVSRLCVPTLGGALAGLVLLVGRRVLGATSTTDYMEALSLGQSVMRPKPIIVRCLSSVMTIASGGAIGREGVMVQLSALAASVAGERVGVNRATLRLWIGCGVAAGLASAYHAPIGAALFVAEIAFASVAMPVFGPLVFAAVMATLTTQRLGETGALYQCQLAWTGIYEVVPAIIVGALAGLVASVFVGWLAFAKGFFARLPDQPVLRLSLGGLMVGAISLYFPAVWGNGNEMVTALIHRPEPPCALIAVSLAKALALAATTGSGAAGGLFTPTLFAGAAVGTLVGQSMQQVMAAAAPQSAPFALVGMGAFLAATTKAPVMAILMVFEMSLDYSMVMPLMLACTSAYFVAMRLNPTSVYRIDAA